MSNMYDVGNDSFLVPTEEMNQKALEAINNTWQSIASDYLALGADIGEECNSISRAEMLDVVLDANRMEDYASMEVCQYIIWIKWFKPTAWKSFCKKLCKRY